MKSVHRIHGIYDLEWSRSWMGDFLPTPEGVRLPTSLIGFCRISVGPSPQSEGANVQAGIEVPVHL